MTLQLSIAGDASRFFIYLFYLFIFSKCFMRNSLFGCGIRQKKKKKEGKKRKEKGSEILKD